MEKTREELCDEIVMLRDEIAGMEEQIDDLAQRNARLLAERDQARLKLRCTREAS
ncbi:hypothetical protein [Kushneria phosphatilytica]|uniref:hypothetical protein n=1 Tax=Kushneria phosphatilytica TaxID=657387 RepID=UPI001438CE39|nr:hypothetical protein [Kushneria phosphatilytica]